MKEQHHLVLYLKVFKYHHPLIYFRNLNSHMHVYSAIKSVTLPQETILTSLSGVIKASDVDALQGYTVKKKIKTNLHMQEWQRFAIIQILFWSTRNTGWIAHLFLILLLGLFPNLAKTLHLYWFPCTIAWHLIVFHMFQIQKNTFMIQTAPEPQPCV